MASTMDMDFSTAIRHVVQSHQNEINELQAENLRLSKVSQGFGLSLPIASVSPRGLKNVEISAKTSPDEQEDDDNSDGAWLGLGSQVSTHQQSKLGSASRAADTICSIDLFTASEQVDATLATKSQQRLSFGFEDHVYEEEDFSRISPTLSALRRDWNVQETITQTKSMSGTLSRNTRNSQTVLRVVDTAKIHPDSMLRFFWDVSSAITLVYDSIMIPYTVAWNPQVEGFIEIGMYWTTIFWTLDILMTLNTSYFNELGELETRFKYICCRYLKTVLLFDIGICTSDWIGLVMEIQRQSESRESLAFFRVMKANRILRLASVFRVSRLKVRLEQLNHMFMSGTWQVLVKVSGIFVFIVWLNHLLCCTWFIFGVHGVTDTGQRWLDSPVYPKSDLKIAKTSVFFQYTAAFHWSISQLTPGSVPIMPMNSMERVLNIFYLLFGLLFCTSLISRLSALMIQLQKSNPEHKMMMKSLQTFLRQKSVSVSLARRLQKSVQAHWEAKKTLTLSELPALNAISRGLRSELKFEIFSPYLPIQPVFLAMQGLSGRLFVAVCDVLESRQLVANEELFVRGIQTRTSYILLDGSMTYHKGTQRDSPMASPHYAVAHSIEVTASTNTWISSAALWMEWTTLGSLEADALTEVIVADGKDILCTISRLSSRMKSFVTHYQQVYSRLAREATSPASDLEARVDHVWVASFLPLPTKVELCLPIIESMKQRSWVRWGFGQDLSGLEADVALGTCMLVATHDGPPMRVVIVVGLRVMDLSGALLVQVGIINKNSLKHICRLPRTKVYHGVTLSETSERLLAETNDDLHRSGDVHKITLGETWDTDVEMIPSPTYGLITQYRTTSFLACSHRKSELPPRVELLTRGSANGLRRSVAAMSRHVPFSAPCPSLSHGDVMNSISSAAPWLQPLCQHHMAVSEHGTGKGSVWAWLHPEDFNSLDEFLRPK